MKGLTSIPIEQFFSRSVIDTVEIHADVLAVIVFVLTVTGDPS